MPNIPADLSLINLNKTSNIATAPTFGSWCGDEPILDLDMSEVEDIGKWWLTISLEDMLNLLLKLEICPPQVKDWAKYGSAVLEP